MKRRNDRSAPADTRFANRYVVDPNGCWVWQLAPSRGGYGIFNYGGASGYAHRWSYEYHVGPIPEGLTIDHLCRNRMCVNPAHLEPVTSLENLRRGAEATRRGRYATHCKNGHEFTPESVRWSPEGWRICRLCRSAKRRARRVARTDNCEECGGTMAGRRRGARFCSVACGRAARNRRLRDQTVPRSPRIRCANGHPMTPDNSYTRPDTGNVVCRTCSRHARRRHAARQRDTA